MIIGLYKTGFRRLGQGIFFLEKHLDYTQTH